MFIIPKSYYRIKTLRNTGRGVFATHDIDAGTVLGDYLGTIIRPDSSDESIDGLYDMRGGLRYDILANPKHDGVHLVNHSCANNCDAYPYQGHILYVAIRKIFKGEEITVNYSLYVAEEKDMTCGERACHCGSKICTGTMYENQVRYDTWYEAWEKLVRREFGPWYRKVPGKYGAKLAPLAAYPAEINTDIPKIYPNIFGSEARPTLRRTDTTLPSLREMKNIIRKTGRQLSFPKIHLTIYGIRDDVVLATRDAG